MYKLRFTAETESELMRLVADEALAPTVVIDRGVQCDLPPAEPGPAQSAQQRPCNSPALFRPLASGGGHRDERPSVESVADDGDAFGTLSGLFGDGRLASPLPWLDEDGVCEPCEGETAVGDGAQTVERVSVPFYSGQSCAELCAGSVGFYRYEHPSGVLGLSSPPLRSSLLAMLNVPASMTSAELLKFVGAYLRCVRHARLVRSPLYIYIYM